MIDKLGGALWMGAVCVAASAALTASAAPSFEGTWSGVFTTQDNEFWQLEDFDCFAGCPPEAYAYYTKLLDDPANDEKPIENLTGQVRRFHARGSREAPDRRRTGAAEPNTPSNDPTIFCQAYGFVRESTNPLPIVIRRDGDNLAIQYEEWSENRNIYLDGRNHPKTLTPTPLGHSVGRYEGDTLVVDTVGLSADIYYSFMSGGGYSDQAHVTERIHSRRRSAPAQARAHDRGSRHSAQPVRHREDVVVHAGREAREGQLRGRIQPPFKDRRMKTTYAALAACCIGLISPAHAHHSAAVYYQLDKQVTVEGKVTEYTLGNPHARIYFTVKGANGQDEAWMAEGGSRTVLLRKGWTGEEVKPGDVVKIVGNPSRDGRHVIHWQTLILPNGKEMWGEDLDPKKLEELRKRRQ